MDDTHSSESGESTNNGTIEHVEPEKLKPSYWSWKSQRAIGFILVFVIIGGYLIIRSFAATVAETKVWNTAAEWNTGTLSDVAVASNDVTLAPASGTTSTSGGAGAPVTTPAAKNISDGRPGAASSVQRGTYNGTYYNLAVSSAFDGNLNTRWGSSYSAWTQRNSSHPVLNPTADNNQWIYVNLGAVYNISEVKLYWQAAYGKAYDIQVSNDAKSWTTIYSTTTGTGGINDLTGLKGSGQYVRMLGITRGTQWGYSLWEMDVFGTPASTTTPTPAPVSSYDGSGTITLDYNAGTSVSWTSLTPVATTPSGTAISYQARTSSNNSTWSAWSSSVTSLASSQYIQIEASLSTNNTASTPSLSSLTLGYNTPVATPTASLSVGSTTITSGQSTLLTWSSTNATSCSASGGWSGTQAISGTQTITPTQTSTYSLTCSGTGGTSSASSVTVTVSPPASGGGGTGTTGSPIAPSNVAMPAVQSGWYTVFDSDFSTPEAFGSVGDNGFPGWHGPYCNGTSDTSKQRGEGSGEWVCDETVTVGPNNSGDGTAVPANVLDIWQHIDNGTPVSAVLLPNCTGTATNGCSTTQYGSCDTSYDAECDAINGLTSECVAFEFRVTPYPSTGYKMVPLLWVDTPTQTQDGIQSEIDSPEAEFGQSTVTAALHSPDGEYIDPNFSLSNGTYTNNINWTTATPSNINLSNWTEWETCRVPGKITISIDGQLAFTATTGETYNEWGQEGTVTIPTDLMHWVLQTETTTEDDSAAPQPSGNDADHVQFNWVQITAPNP